jgi:hypothetical protein
MKGSGKVDNHTIFGGGSVGTGCGNYNFTIYAADFQPGDDGTEKPNTIHDANPSGSVVSSIEAVLTSSFGLTATKKVESVAETSTGSSSVISSSSTSSTTKESTTSAAETTSGTAATTTTSASSVVALSTGIVTNETITTSGPFGNSTVVILTTASGVVGPLTSVVWTTGTAGVGGSTVTGAAAAPVSTGVNSMGNIVSVAGWRLIVVGLLAMLL